MSVRAILFAAAGPKANIYTDAITEAGAAADTPSATYKPAIAPIASGPLGSSPIN